MEIKTYKARLVHHGGKTLLHFGRYLDGAALNIELTTPHGTAATSCVWFHFISFPTTQDLPAWWDEAGDD